MIGEGGPAETEPCVQPRAPLPYYFESEHAPPHSRFGSNPTPPPGSPALGPTLFPPPPCFGSNPTPPPGSGQTPLPSPPFPLPLPPGFGSIPPLPAPRFGS